MSVRIVMLVSHPIQYYVPIYRTMAATPGIELIVLYLCRAGIEKSYDPGFGKEIAWDIPLLDGYSHHFLSEHSDSGGINMRVLKAIRDIKPDVLISHGYDKPTNMLAIVGARLMGIPVLIRSDTRLTDINLNPGYIKDKIKRFLFNLASGFIAIGTKNREFYKWNGVPDDKIYFAPFSVNNNFFYVDDSRRQLTRTETRNKMGIAHDACVVLSACKLIPIKRVQDAILAIAKIANSQPRVRLLLVGSGEMEHELRALAHELGLADIVLFAGFLNQSEMPSVYAASDMFVLASEVEPWGLAVNEAMAGGLPCIVSDQVGCAVDLVDGKGTGVVYPCGNIDLLAQAIDGYVSNPNQLKEAANRAGELIKHWDNDVCANKIYTACESVTC